MAMKPEAWVDYDHPPIPHEYEKCKKCGDDLVLQHHCVDMMRQVRKALTDIQQSFADSDADRAEMEVYWLHRMIDATPSHPWSHYQPMIDEEYEL